MAAVLVTAGPTREHIDDVRFLANGSTGRMGFAIAAAAHGRGHEVQLVAGPTHLEPPAGVHVHRVVSALEMQAEAERLYPATDLVFGVAAVSDYRPARRMAGKPAKSEDSTVLHLTANPDIIASIGARKGDRVVVGFALQVVGKGGMEGVMERAREKLVAKELDLIVVNLADAMGAEQSEVVLLWADGTVEHLPCQSKEATAGHIVDAAIGLLRGGRK